MLLLSQQSALTPTLGRLSLSSSHQIRVAAAPSSAKCQLHGAPLGPGQIGHRVRSRPRAEQDDKRPSRRFRGAESETSSGSPALEPSLLASGIWEWLLITARSTDFAGRSADRAA